jgi:hypothetical protein
MLRAICRAFLLLFGIVLVACPAGAGEESPCVSGPKTGQRPGPYSSIVVTGEHRGQSHCFICETADRPAVIIFARNLSAPLGKLVSRLDGLLLDKKNADLAGWVTLLAADEAAANARVVEWSKKYALRAVPLGVFEDTVGPPVYRLHKDADVTVLLCVNQKVQRNFAFRAGELTNDRIDEIIKEVPDLVRGAKK